MLKSILKFDGVQQLTKKNQKTINGGNFYAGYTCRCIGSIGVWVGQYDTISDVNNAIKTNCANGLGSCRPLS